MNKPIAIALAFAAAVPAASAAGTTDRIVKNEIVRFDDLNLASAAGVKTLERRIQFAARRVCDYYATSRSSPMVQNELSACVANALASARRDVAAKTGTRLRKG